ncbi:MAG: OmpA family protein [Paludibacteraceae bacterium]|nr:OmpA family protein [Paludibacteraceae bacterium]
MKRIQTLIALLILPLLVFSQSEEEKKADKYYQDYSFYEAINKYTQIDDLTVEGLRNLAECYKNTNQFLDAESIYAKVVNSPSPTVADYYNYILMLKNNGKYKDVKKWYEKLQEESPEDLRAKNFFSTDSVFQSLLKPNRKYKISDLKMNSGAQDFGASFYKNQLTFTSSRKGFNPFRSKYNWNKKPFLDIYVADIEPNYEISNIRYWNKKTNKKWHQGPISFAKDGNFAAYTRNNYTDTIPKDGIVRLQLFFIHFENGEWTEPEPFYLNSSTYSVGHPSLSKDGNTMYFVSDMPGGYGGSDIYVVTKAPGSNSWGKPVNLGDKINTEANELFPFYEDKGGLLFFSSNGLNGLGGLDVYVATKTPRGFENIQNLGAPINTRYDDFSYIIAENHKYGYLSSNRTSGKGDDDIYKFTFSGDFKQTIPSPKPIPVKTDTFKGFSYRLYVFNKESHKPIFNADVKLGDFKQTTDGAGFTSRTIVNAIDYKVAVSAVGYKDKHLRVTVPTFRDGYVMTDTVFLEPNLNKKILLKNIYYDYDKSDILSESSVELDKLVTFMKDNPKLQVELSSHTDSRGSDSYNMTLSEGRAKSAVNYIVHHGVDALRITAKGYGETRLVNGCANGVKCTEAQHRQNRRTEVFITGGYGKAQDIEQVKGKR